MKNVKVVYVHITHANQKYLLVKYLVVLRINMEQTNHVTEMEIANQTLIVVRYPVSEILAVKIIILETDQMVNIVRIGELVEVSIARAGSVGKKNGM